jgi:hypothetical protein
MRNWRFALLGWLTWKFGKRYLRRRASVYARHVGPGRR